MTLRVAVDNDVLIKLACYDLLDVLCSEFEPAGSLGVLGAAPFVVRDHLRRDGRAANISRSLEAFRTFATAVQLLEPSPTEIDFATMVEEAAIRAGLELDGGESQLCAIVIHRALAGLLTGDKRAIAAIDELIQVVAELGYLAGRVSCLEQIMRSIIAVGGGGSAVRLKVCASPSADRAVSICFGCTGSGFDDAGLTSYIESLRRDAPTVLRPGMTAW